MPQNGQAPSRRMHNHGDAQRPRDPREELSQLAGSVERRRLQNKISQRNYRNRIRDRLEALEALVEDKAKTQISNSSKGSEYAESTTSNGASRKVTHHTQLLTPEDSSVLPDDSTSWNFNDFSEASAAHFDSMYSFSEPNTPMEIYQPKSASPSAFDEDVPNADPSLANQPSLGISSATAVKKQLAVAGTEDLDSSTVNSSQPESTSSVAQAAPGKTSGQSNFHHAFSYGYPVSPFSGAVQPLMPSPYPAYMYHQNANVEHATQTPPSPFATQPMQQLGLYQPQHYVWVPVPVMTIPAPQPQPCNSGSTTDCKI